VAKSAKKTAKKAERPATPPSPPAEPRSKKGEPAGGWLEWRQTSKDTWLSDDPGGDKSKAGGRIKMSGQKWLHGPDADPTYFVYRDGEYLGQDSSLEGAQRRAQYREKSSTLLGHTIEGGGMPAFLNLTQEERRKHRGAAPPAPARPAWGGGKPPAPAAAPAPAPPEDPVLAKAMAERAALAGASAASRAAKKAARREAKDALRFEDDAVITATVDKNPRKPGTGAHARFALLMEHSGKTVREYREAKGNMETLENAVKDGRASVAEKE
jgi:hypothetical protein